MSKGKSKLPIRIGDDTYGCSECGEVFCVTCSGIERCEECDEEFCPECWTAASGDVDGDGLCGPCRELLGKADE